MDLLAQLEHDEDGVDDPDESRQRRQKAGSLDSIDGSASGPLAGKVHRCEGALDAIALLEVSAASWMECCGVAAIVSNTQSRTMMAMKEARAAASVADLAKEKLDDVDGRLDGGTTLYVLLAAAHPHENPRPLVRGLLGEYSHALHAAERELEANRADLAMAEESHAKLHQTLGKVAFLRMAATRLAFETRKAFWRERTALLGKIFGSQSAYAHLKTVNAARRAVHAAVSHGEAMEKLESHLVTELTAAKVRVTLVGVTDGIPLAKDRLTGAVLELVLGELMAFAGLEADDWSRLHVSAMTNVEVPGACGYLSIEGSAVAAVQLEFEVHPTSGSGPSVSDVLDILDERLGAAAFATATAANSSYEHQQAIAVAAAAAAAAGVEGGAPGNGAPAEAISAAHAQMRLDVSSGHGGDAFPITATHLGLEVLRIGASHVQHPARAGADESADRLPISQPLRKSLDVTVDMRAHLEALAREKQGDKALEPSGSGSTPPPTASPPPSSSASTTAAAPAPPPPPQTAQRPTARRAGLRSPRAPCSCCGRTW